MIDAVKNPRFLFFAARIRPRAGRKLKRNFR